MLDLLRQLVLSQLEASVCMLDECIRKCPAQHWDSPIGKYPFWHVAYHTLCFIDVYLSPSDEAWQPRQGGPGGGLHPLGRVELEEEYPSRRFEQCELLEYSALCRQKARDVLTSETRETLEGPSGFPWLAFSRAEAHVYNIRHIQHHAGQLSAFLRRQGVETHWVKSGWRENV
ncbi:MAG: DinB family protein [Phycisphaerae bacterium]